MNAVKKYLGLVWMVLGPLAIAILIWGAATNIDSAGKADINKPLPWIIIIVIFTPIAIGLSIFGWYVWKDEYRSVQEKDATL
jgi:type VI protein secretion system component VasK